MRMRLKIAILAIMILALVSGSVWAVQAADAGRNYSSHSYHQQKQEKKVQQEILPEIIHHPPLQISSTEDFYITAEIKNLGNGIPIIYYRFDGDKNFYKRAMRKSTSSENFQFMILGAALTGKQFEYYIQVATGSRVLASLGDDKTPITVAILAPQHNSTILYLAVAAVIIGLIVKTFVSASNKSNKENNKEKTRVTKALNDQLTSKKKKPQLSARSR